MNAISGHRPHTLPPGPLKVALIPGCMIEMRGEPAAGFSQTFGGDTLNAAVYLSRLNHDSQVVVDYVTAIGADTFSESMRRLWGDEGIGHQHVCVIEGALPGLCFIQTDPNGERRFLLDSLRQRSVRSAGRAGEEGYRHHGDGRLFQRGLSLVSPARGDPQLAARWGHRLAAQVVQHRGALIPTDAMPSLTMSSFSSAVEA
jgi:sugar/nucleoside kinase (ribokinase family)